MNDIDASEDYRKLIQAVIEYSITNYIKYQHPKNRKTKSQKEDFLLTLQIFFDSEYRFEHFQSPETLEDMSTPDMISYMLNGAEASMSKTHSHIINESIDYWWTKNFHDIKVPEIITISGKVWKTVNSPNNSYIDWDNQRLYLPVKKRGADRLFFKQTLQILLKESEVQLDETNFEKFYKLFYLFLKVNDAFK